MEKVSSESGEALWLLTDKELKTLFVATGCVSKDVFNKGLDDFTHNYGITYGDTEKLWNLIDDILLEDRPDEASS